MNQSLERLRVDLAAARKDYLRDMKWLRQKFGIIPDPRPDQVKLGLWHALNALEKQDADSLDQAIKAFKKMHRGMMKETVWQVLEDSKRALKKLRSCDQDLFAQKLLIWNQASHYFTNFNTPPGQPLSTNYRKALLLLAKL